MEYEPETPQAPDTAEAWFKEYRDDGDGPLQFADGSLVCMIKNGPNSIVAYDVAEPDADAILRLKDEAREAQRLRTALEGAEADAARLYKAMLSGYGVTLAGQAHEKRNRDRAALEASSEGGAT